MSESASTQSPTAPLPVASLERAFAADNAALSDMRRSFEHTVAQVEKSIALLAESASLLREKGINFDLAALRARQLRMAERHVADGERIVRRQRELVAALERDGHDASAAKLLLEQFEEMHHLQVVHLSTLRDVANAEASHSD